ncbi:Spx/MgsR family RNA polymerase-binding regulatory protein [Clostridium sp.]|jgi:arsenate reductase|uniref:Spx/MgsR family RNA polymerase-binding regulatory protein n=1 Tax=Clostridium sp. TaxID=1506 RepID=UPI0025C579BD|nr:Spx/MgsR family RNA polymerase-binding regulatory protein [Clostridium sp.]MCI9070929.1 Spx/MgsR family RNA polymerase-binding regulatory protein [Clostridium sp.]MCI9304337.1 Spx/MgsR family RNA polymerase-binding regulatory protein [Clostridium sp.]
MKKLFLQYPKCTTCKKAKKFLQENNIEFNDRDITIENPTIEELEEWINLSGLEVKKFFNTSGVLYREMKLKDKIKDMSKEEMIKLLATDGKLVKRPLLICKDKVLVGFKEEQYKEIL